MDRRLAGDLGEDGGDLGKADLGCNHREVEACRFRRVVKDPEIVNADIGQGDQGKLGVARYRRMLASCWAVKVRK